jgi:glycosyltransferase involved in cell wall biosynthesis
MGKPKISVLIPTYNYGRYLAQALESVLMQTFTDFEILVVDNCSSDDTNEVIQRFKDCDSRIRYIRNPSTVDMVRAAKGEYIKFLFSDDFLVSPMALELLAGALDSNSSVSLVGSSRKVVDNQSRPVDLWAFYREDVVQKGSEVIKGCLYNRCNYIGEPTAVMFRSSQAARGFDDRYRQLVDLEMWFHLLEQGDFAYINKPLCVFRKHDMQQTAKNNASHATFEDELLLVQEYLDKPCLGARSFTRVYLRYETFYKVWKLYREKRGMTLEKALNIIGRYGTAMFFMLYPLYKMYKPIFRKRSKKLLEAQS